MSRPNLRSKPRVCYYELEEPNFDEYTYCEECSDFVYEYCAIHGPLLIIPDDKVTSKTSYPPYVPRAALTIPQVFLHLAPSVIPGAGLGVFSSLTLPRGVRFGPYCGKRTQDADSMYCWQIYDRNNKRSHVVDAVDADRSNWMRYVNCARHWKEQNMLAYQYQGQLYYRTIKIIPRFTELMVFYGSEYAHALRINLSLYNSPLGYARTFGTTTKVIESKNKEDPLDITEVPHDNIHKRKDEIEEYVSIDEFEIIDENDDQNQNDKNNVETSIALNDKSGNCYDKNSSIEVSFSGDNININFNNINENKTHKCHICDKFFAKSKYLKDHITRHFSKFNCDICNYKTNSKSRFEEHVENHTKIFDYNCNLCFYKTNTRSHFNRHYRLHQRTEKPAIKSPSTCTYSNRFKNIIKDLENYTDVFEYNCNLCTYKTNTRSYFNRHYRLHQRTEKPTIKLPNTSTDNNCSKNTIRDVENHTEFFEYNCNICIYKTNNKSYFNRHYRRHQRIEKQAIKSPNTSTDNNCSKNTIRDVENHTEIFEYNCNLCIYKTNNKSYFNRHYRRHQRIEKQAIKSPSTSTSRNRPKITIRQCEICEFNTWSYKRFSTHMSQHRGNIYKCDHCDYSNHTKYNLRRHIARNHH